jgi:hypothetical protein
MKVFWLTLNKVSMVSVFGRNGIIVNKCYDADMKYKVVITTVIVWFLSAMALNAQASTLQAPELTALAPRAPSNGTYWIHWTPVPDATQYKLQYGTDPTFKDFRTSSTGLLTWTDRFVVAKNTTYYYRVQAINEVGLGLWSNVVKVTILP